jgi:serine/threonine-protein kinase RsbT
MSDILMKKVYPVAARDFATAGEASGRIKNTLKQLGVDMGVVRRVAIASYEAELNLVIHSDGGEMELCVTPSTVTITTRDKGPGIPDLDLAMQEGYSTASDSIREMGFGAGMGLANMKRCATAFQIASKVGEGTTVTMTF